MSIRELSDNEVSKLANQGTADYSKAFIETWRNCDIDEDLPNCIADVYIAGCIARLNLVGGAAQNQIMAWGFAGTPNAAQAILNVGRSLGKHFEFLDKQNQPTAYFV